jgi:hypothetical protein
MKEAWKLRGLVLETDVGILVLLSQTKIEGQGAALYIFTPGGDLHLTSHLEVDNEKFRGAEYAKTTFCNLDRIRSLQDHSVHLFLAVYRCLTW